MKPTYALYMHYRPPYRVYAWTKDGVCFTSRAVAPLGWVRMTPDELIGFTVRDLRYNGFRKQSTRMTQDQLAQGMLFY